MSECFEYSHGPLTVVQLRALTDNYVYILKFSETTGAQSSQVTKSNEVTVVDPSEAKPVIEFLEKNNLRLKTILCTHHHNDHVGGNAELYEKYRCQVICSKYDQNRVPAANKTVLDNDVITISGHDIHVLNVPGHTLGAVAYYSAALNICFVGDTLFTFGCGRLFEGTAAQMYESFQRLKHLSHDLKVYCGHEYTAQNLPFTFSLREKLKNKIDFNMLDKLRPMFKSKISAGKPTVPSFLGDEIKFNPFMVAENPDEFATIRSLKDQFRLEPNAALR